MIHVQQTSYKMIFIRVIYSLPVQVVHVHEIGTNYWYGLWSRLWSLIIVMVTRMHECMEYGSCSTLSCSNLILILILVHRQRNRNNSSISQLNETRVYSQTYSILAECQRKWWWTIVCVVQVVIFYIYSSKL